MVKRGANKISEIEITDKELIKARNGLIAAVVVGQISLSIVVALRAFVDVGTFILSFVLCLIPLILGSVGLITFYVKPDKFKQSLIQLKQAKAMKKAKKQE